MDHQDDGQRHRARIVAAVNKHDDDLRDDEDVKKFRVSINDDEYEELLSYEQVLQYITARENNEGEIVWQFKRIISHQGPLRSGDPGYNGSRWNVMVEWENGEITSEPLGMQ